MELTTPRNPPPPQITFRVYVITNNGELVGVRLTGADAIEAVAEGVKAEIRNYTEGDPYDADLLVISIEHNPTGFVMRLAIGDVPYAKYRVTTFTTDQPLTI